MNRLIIIGGGPAGYETALLAQSAGFEVTLIEKHRLGGVCLWEGCIPTKTMLQSAQLYEQMKKSEVFGIHTKSLKLNFQEVKVRKLGVSFRLLAGITSRLEAAQIAIVEGEATIVDAKTVEVNQQRLEADIIMIATGSHCHILNIPGSKLARVLSAADLLSIHEIPKRLVIIGSGVIGCEFASLFAALGSQVTLLEAQPRLLPSIDQEVARRLQTAFKRQKIEIKTRVNVMQISDNNQLSVQVHFREKEQQKTIEADYVLMAVGRQPNLDTNMLDAVKIEYTKQGISVNQHYQTSIPSIYAIGDINGKSMLAHSAIFQGKVAINHLLNKDHQINFETTPHVIFTLPEIAFVGKKEEELIKGEYTVYKSLYGANGMAVIQDETYGFAKLITDKDDKLIGAHIIGKGASTLIGETSMALKNNMNLSAFQEVIHAHPTLSEIWQDLK